MQLGSNFYWSPRFNYRELHVEDAPSLVKNCFAVQEVKPFLAPECTNQLSDISIITEQFHGTFTSARLFSYLSVKLRTKRTRLHDIRFLPELTPHSDILCDECGTRLSIGNSGAPWATIMVNVEFTEKSLYYCEYFIDKLDSIHRFLMFGFIDKAHYSQFRRYCLRSRFYASDIRVIEEKDKIGLYLDSRKSNIEMLLYINDQYHSSKFLDEISLSLSPVISIANDSYIIRLNPNTFTMVSDFHVQPLL